MSTIAAESSIATPARFAWLFSAKLDLAAFLGSALVALGLVAVGAAAGWLHEDTPDWTWVSAILLIDVAHVYATAFRVYFDPAELRRRLGLYTLTPVLGWLFGVALYSESDQLFWRVLAYLAVFHFVRQQYGWVALYRAKAGETDAAGRWMDSLAVYLATVYPLVYWHTHLPRDFWWFLPNDFAQMPQWVERLLWPVYLLALGSYAARSAWGWLGLGRGNPGKDLVVATTAVCWYVGIVALNSDYAFTVTNVIIHGVPYLVLVYWNRFVVGATPAYAVGGRLQRLVLFLASLWLLAYLEELFWHRAIWHERTWLFGNPIDAGSAKVWLVPLLAVPQLTHYVLDGFIWKRRRNPRFHFSTHGNEGSSPSPAPPKNR